jgi:hypothetical protein
MTRRNEIKKDLERGWVHNIVAMAFLQVDLSVLEEMTRQGIVSSSLDRSSTLYKLDDILVFTQRSAKELLNKHFPVRRQKKSPSRQQVNVFTTQTQREAWMRNWHRLHEHVGALIASPEEDARVGELRLIHQLMRLAYRVNSFRIVQSREQLEKGTDLDDETLPIARRSLERRNMLLAERNGTEWVYTLLNPKTKQPFDNQPVADILIEPASSWSEWTES